nr:MAG TPA: Cytosine specific methyltransferase [Caudoviricetes sp.]
MNIKTFGSVCSGIEAASYVLKPQGVKPLWLSEIEDFPCKFLAFNYSETPNLGDMNDIPSLIKNGKIEAPDLLCGGTPCQAFSLAGWRKGLNDDRGNLTLKFFDILNQMDKVRISKGLDRAICLWENVEGVLTDKENAFGYFLAGLAGLDEPIISPLGKRYKKIKIDNKIIKKEIPPKWENAGILYGKDRNIAWRVLDAKYFGLPQQRKRLYVIAGGKDFHPENILFENGDKIIDPFKKSINTILSREINGHDIEIFREYTDCLYAAYGTKWNGNAAAMNGSLFVVQDGRLRRLTPIECERIMGFSDNYTLLPKCKMTQRFKAIGNSWAINVIKWITERLCDYDNIVNLSLPKYPTVKNHNYTLYLMKDFVLAENDKYINANKFSYNIVTANLLDFIDTEPNNKLYISEKGCDGILKRMHENNHKMNNKLKLLLKRNSSKYKL